MQQTRRHRGFLLIMAVALLPLFGLTILLTTAQTSQISRGLRIAERLAEEKSLLLSAEAWLRVHGTAVRAGEPGATIVVPIGDIASQPTVCIAEIAERSDRGTNLVLTLTIEEPRKPRMVTRHLFLSAGD